RCSWEPEPHERRSLGPSPHRPSEGATLAFGNDGAPLGRHRVRDGQHRHLDPTTSVLVIALLVALAGALAGTAGFAVLVVRRQNRRLTALAERLTEAQDEGSLVAIDARRIGDERLRAAFQALADRVAATWRVAPNPPPPRERS